MTATKPSKRFPATRTNRLLPALALFALVGTLGACSQESQPSPSVPVPPELSGLEVAAPERNELIFSSVQHRASGPEAVTLKNVGDAPLELSELALSGPDASAFSLSETPPLPAVIEPGDSLSAEVSFLPREPGVYGASLDIESNDPDAGATSIGLHGLGTLGEQGSLEPPLQQVVDTLGYSVDVGGSALELGSSESAIGSEALIPLFRKAGSGPVTLTVVARYGPNEDMPFGYFTLASDKPRRAEVAQVAAEDAQRLLPPLRAGTGSFDPGAETFGLYAQAGGGTQYSVDGLNTGISHALRAYPLRDRSGQEVPESYLIGLEEAENADYQDAVFVISNVEPADAAASEVQTASGWEALFNGSDLSGWDSYLPSQGRNHDPEGVFRAENGVLHILGVPNRGQRDFGYLATQTSYSDYQLRLEYKWGEKRFAPRENSKRDSGVVYHVSGGDKIWPRGVEFQIQESDTGDFWMIGGTTMQTTVESPEVNEPQYRQHGRPFTSRAGDFVRIVKDGTYERPGAWNTVLITVRGNTATHAVNGIVNNRAYSLFSPDGSPLTGGKILLQAEGAEIFYRNIEIRKLEP